MQLPNELFNLLISKDFTVKTLDSKGKPVVDLEKADMFSFDFEVGKNNYGTTVILLNNNEFEVFYGDNIGKRMDATDKDAWFDFLYQLRMFAKRNMMSFSLKNINKLKYTMQGMAAIKEGLFEGWDGTSKTSYNEQPGKTRIIVKHNKKLGEGEARFRNIDALFVENASGERFKLPFKTLVGARAMARHVSEGGTPYDVFGQHIIDIVNEITTLSGFVRSTKKINEDEPAFQLVELGRDRYKSLRSRLKSLSSKRRYDSYKESWTPEEIEQDDTLLDDARQMFTKQTVDNRIEEALPVLLALGRGAIGALSSDDEDVDESLGGDPQDDFINDIEYNVGAEEQGSVNDEFMDKLERYSRRIPGRETTMKEIDEFNEWAEDLVEGTWSLPETDRQVKQLKELMKNPIPIGVDAMNATGLLYDLIGDDDLFDSFGHLAEDDPDLDARPVIESWLQKNKEWLAGEGIDVDEILAGYEWEDPHAHKFTEDATKTGRNTVIVLNRVKSDQEAYDRLSLLKKAGIDAELGPRNDKTDIVLSREDAGNAIDILQAAGHSLSRFNEDIESTFESALACVDDIVEGFDNRLRNGSRVPIGNWTFRYVPANPGDVGFVERSAKARKMLTVPHEDYVEVTGKAHEHESLINSLQQLQFNGYVDEPRDVHESIQNLSEANAMSEEDIIYQLKELKKLLADKISMKDPELRDTVVDMYRKLLGKAKKAGVTSTTPNPQYGYDPSEHEKTTGYYKLGESELSNKEANEEVADDGIRVDDKVHIGHGTPGGSGVEGVIYKIEDGMVYIKNDEGRSFRGPIKNVTKMMNEEPIDQRIFTKKVAGIIERAVSEMYPDADPLDYLMQKGLFDQIESRGLDPITEIDKAAKFLGAESYQDYLNMMDVGPGTNMQESNNNISDLLKLSGLSD